MSRLSPETMDRMRRRILYAEKNQNRPTLYMNHYVEDMKELLRVLNDIEQRAITIADINEAFS